MKKNSFDEYLGGFVVFLMVLGALLGGVFGAGLILSSPEFQKALDRSALLLVWVVLMGANAAVSWAGIVPCLGVCINGFRGSKKESRHRKWMVWSLILIVVVIALGVSCISHFNLNVSWPLGTGHSRRMVTATITILFPVLCAITGMWFTAVQTEETFQQTETKDKQDSSGRKGASAGLIKSGTLSDYASLNGQLNGLLWFGGVVVGIGVLTTGALRSAMIQGEFATAKTFPQALVLAYGLFFTLLLIVSYLPAYLLVRRAGNHLVRKFATSEEPFAWHEQRMKLKEALNLGGDFQETIKTTLAILAPLLAGLVSLALPGTPP